MGQLFAGAADAVDDRFFLTALLDSGPTERANSPAVAAFLSIAA
jgi:hypothetical protein